MKIWKTILAPFIPLIPRTYISSYAHFVIGNEFYSDNYLKYLVKINRAKKYFWLVGLPIFFFILLIGMSNDNLSIANFLAFAVSGTVLSAIFIVLYFFGIVIYFSKNFRNQFAKVNVDWYPYTPPTFQMPNFFDKHFTALELLSIDIARKNINGYTLNGIDLSYRHLEGFQFINVNMENAKFKNSNLKFSEILSESYGSNFKGVDFSNSDLRYSWIEYHVLFDNSNFSGVQLDGTIIFANTYYFPYDSEYERVNWFSKLRSQKVQGVDELEAQYKIVSLKNEFKVRPKYGEYTNYPKFIIIKK